MLCESRRPLLDGLDGPDRYSGLFGSGAGQSGAGLNVDE
jgi:hypothetical protein